MKSEKVCPMCGSRNVKWLLGGRTGDQYKCVDCNYQGIILEGDENFAEELKKRGEENA